MYNFEHSVILWILGVVVGGFFAAKLILDFVEYAMENFGSEDDPHQ